MQFKEGTNVYTLDDEKVGTVDRVVLDPGSKEVADLIVQEGFFFTESKVLPIQLVQTATAERVTLNCRAADLPELDRFEDRHYLASEQADATATYAQPIYWYPPVGASWWGPTSGGLMGYPTVPYVARVEQNIPEGTVALKEGANVYSTDDEYLGDIEQVFTDPDSHRATHLLISQGLFFKERTLVPTMWISSVSEDAVWLRVDAEVLDKLPAYQEESSLA